jgi:hypothetical protein
VLAVSCRTGTGAARGAPLHDLDGRPEYRAWLAVVTDTSRPAPERRAALDSLVPNQDWLIVGVMDQVQNGSHVMRRTPPSPPNPIPRAARRSVDSVLASRMMKERDSTFRALLLDKFLALQHSIQRRILTPAERQQVTARYVCRNRFRIVNPTDESLLMTYDIEGLEGRSREIIASRRRDDGQPADNYFEPGGSGTLHLYLDGTLLVSVRNEHRSCQ